MMEDKRQEKCDNCGKSDQAIVDHLTERWCLDCMRLAGHCVSCDVYIPDIVNDYYTYEPDECPSCNTQNSKGR